MDYIESERPQGQLIQITGTVASVIYQSSESGYTVLRLDVGREKPVTAVGTLPYAAPGETLTLTGAWSTHPSYGEQFKAQWAERQLPTTERAVYDYLASGAVRGVGPATAKAIVEQFGQRALEVIEEQPERLSELKGISRTKAREIGFAFSRQASLRMLIEFLTRYGISPTLAMRLYKAYGDEALSALRDDPYILSDPNFGGDFHAADALALGLGVESDSTRRLMAATLFTLTHNLGNGHCFIPRDKLIAATSGLLEISQELCADALDRLIQSGQVILSSLRGLDACYLENLYEAEEYVSEHVLSLTRQIPQGKTDVEKLVGEVERDTGITFAPEQREAVRRAAEGSMLLITGAPGTGKTTTVRGILALFDRMGLKTVLAAPTGRAAKRMSELTDREAVTIHRLLGAGYAPDSDTLEFAHCESDPLEADAVILDEASMVDILLSRAVFSALPHDCRLVLVGDADQLPSVGPGCFFSDLIRSGQVPVVYLTEIFRQAKESGIIRNAHLINRGEVPDLKKREKDFFFLSRRTAIDTADTVVDLCSRRLPENMKIPPCDIQVLSPFKRSEAGTIILNNRLQEALNPKAQTKPEKKFGNFIFRQGDRVMQIRNNYDIIWRQSDGTGGQGVFNGDIGSITSVDLRDETVTVDYDGRQAVYAFDQLGEIEPAYAMTVHKSQGSEYRAVVMVAERGPKMLLNRKVLYTGVTRARELLILVGDGKILEVMTENNRQQKRYSGLKLRLAGE